MAVENTNTHLEFRFEGASFRDAARTTSELVVRERCLTEARIRENYADNAYGKPPLAGLPQFLGMDNSLQLSDFIHVLPV